MPSLLTVVTLDDRRSIGDRSAPWAKIPTIVDRDRPIIVTSCDRVIDELRSLIRGSEAGGLGVDGNRIQG
jgi:hypothetical protein